MMLTYSNHFFNISQGYVMLEGFESYVIQIIPGLPPAVVIAVYLLVKNWADVKNAFTRIYTDRHADHASRRQAGQVLQESEINFRLKDRTKERGMEQYERKAVLDILRDQLKHSQEDFTTLQDEMRLLRTEIGNETKLLRGEIGELRKDQSETRIEVNRFRHLLDGFRILLSKIEENTSG